MSTLSQIQEIITQTGSQGQVIELNLSEIPIKKFTPEIKAAIEKCKNLEILILAQCQLQSLDNMPQTDLTAIDLTENKITDAELPKLAKYKNLGQLILNQNQIEKVSSFKVLDKLEHLQELDLSDNPIAKTDNYREQVYKVLPKLDILDRFDKDGNEQIEEGEFDDEEDDEEEEDFDEDDDEDEEDFDEDEQEEDQKPKKKR